MFAFYVFFFFHKNRWFCNGSSLFISCNVRKCRPTVLHPNSEKVSPNLSKLPATYYRSMHKWFAYTRILLRGQGICWCVLVFFGNKIHRKKKKLKCIMYVVCCMASTASTDHIRIQFEFWICQRSANLAQALLIVWSKRTLPDHILRHISVRVPHSEPRTEIEPFCSYSTSGTWGIKW